MNHHEISPDFPPQHTAGPVPHQDSCPPLLPSTEKAGEDLSPASPGGDGMTLEEAALRQMESPPENATIRNREPDQAGPGGDRDAPGVPSGDDPRDSLEVHMKLFFGDQIVVKCLYEPDSSDLPPDLHFPNPGDIDHLLTPPKLEMESPWADCMTDLLSQALAETIPRMDSENEPQ